MFSDQSNCKRHIRIKHLGEEKNATCPNCEKQVLKTDIKRHMKKHCSNKHLYQDQQELQLGLYWIFKNIVIHFLTVICRTIQRSLFSINYYNKSSFFIFLFEEIPLDIRFVLIWQLKKYIFNLTYIFYFRLFGNFIKLWWTKLHDTWNRKGNICMYRMRKEFKKQKGLEEKHCQ